MFTLSGCLRQSSTTDIYNYYSDISAAVYAFNRDEEELLFGYKLETVNYALGYQEVRHSNSDNFENTDNARLVTPKSKKTWILYRWHSTVLQKYRKYSQVFIYLLFTSSRPNSNCSVHSSAEDEVETIKDKLNVSEIHKVITRLR